MSETEITNLNEVTTIAGGQIFRYDIDNPTNLPHYMYNRYFSMFEMINSIKKFSII
jgi:hypothetical protein